MHVLALTCRASPRLSAEFRAAAAVRAAAFYTYPAERAFAAAAHQRMKARCSCLVPWLSPFRRLTARAGRWTRSGRR